jgi:3-oxoacyl-[acyl-carrier protein] reductase
VDLTDKNIVVTGGTGGLGRQVVDSLIRKNSNVMVFDIDENLLDQLRSQYHSIDTAVCDVTDAQQVSLSIKGIYDKWGHIDGLVNIAGMIYSEPLVNLLSPNRLHSLDGWDRTIKVNLTSVFLMTANVIDKMIAKRTKGVVVNISSISSKGNAGQSAYSAAKAGVNALTATWAKEFGVFGIRVVAVSPGFIETPSTRYALNESMVQGLQKEIPLGQLGNAAHIAQSVLHAFECDYINGKIIEVDGGLVL